MKTLHFKWKTQKNILGKWKGVPHQRIDRINIMKMTFLPKATCTFKKKNPNQHSYLILHRNRKKNLKFIWKHRRPQIEINLEQKEQCWKGYNSRSQIHYRAIVFFKKHGYCHKNRHVDRSHLWKHLYKRLYHSTLSSTLVFWLLKSSVPVPK